MTRKFNRVVIKVGTNTLTDEKGMLDRSYLASLADQIAQLRLTGMDVLLVTSGAIRAGMERMGYRERPKTMPEKQAAAAVGQGFLMQAYADVFGSHEVVTGQVLLTREDFGDRKRYLNARNTMLTLFRKGVVPIVNENDTIATEEIRVGDNDNLAALVAANLEADLLILLSDVPGFCDGNPGKSQSVNVIPVITEIDDKIRHAAGDATCCNGTGGMRTKLEAAQIAMNCGVIMVIANGRCPNVILDIAAGEQVGTSFMPKPECLRSRKRWLAFGTPTKGSIIVNDGAKKMICENGKSLLSAGITGAIGKFSGGDMVSVLDQQGNQFARGFVNYSVDEVTRIQGVRSSEIECILGYKDFDEVIHRDNLVLSHR